MLSDILKDSVDTPKTVGYKITKGLLTIEDEEEACKKSQWAYWFSRDDSGADIGKCQEAACKDPYWAYLFAKYIPGADIEKCQEMACKTPGWAYYWAYQFSSIFLGRI